MFNESVSGLEGRVALRQLDEVCNLAQELLSAIPDGADLPEWVQNHITTVNDRLKSVHSYVIYELRRAAPAADPYGMIGQAPPSAAEPGMPGTASDLPPDAMMPKMSAYTATVWGAFQDTLNEKRAFAAPPMPRMAQPMQPARAPMQIPQQTMRPQQMMQPMQAPMPQPQLQPAPMQPFQSSTTPQMNMGPTAMGSFRNALLGM